MPSTSVPAAEDSLLERFASVLGSVVVQPGIPPDESRPREGLYMLAVSNYTRQVIAQQALARESYTVPLQLDVMTYGTGRAVARNRAWELIDLIFDEIAREPRVSGVAQTVEVGSIPEVSVHATTDGWEALADINIDVTAIV